MPGHECKNQIKSGKSFQLELNASYSPDRVKDYLLSDSIYQATSVSFYYDTYHPNGVKILSLKDLKNYKICGFDGYNYTSYGLNEKSPNLDMKSHQFLDVIKKLENKSCDIFIEKLEVAIGQQRIGNGFLDNPHLKWDKIPDNQDESFHILISKSWPQSYKLLHALNKGIKEMKENGEMKKYIEKYSL